MHARHSFERDKYTWMSVTGPCGRGLLAGSFMKESSRAINIKAKAGIAYWVLDLSPATSLSTEALTAHASLLRNLPDL